MHPLISMGTEKSRKDHKIGIFKLDELHSLSPRTSKGVPTVAISCHIRVENDEAIKAKVMMINSHAA